MFFIWSVMNSLQATFPVTTMKDLRFSWRDIEVNDFQHNFGYAEILPDDIPLVFTDFLEKLRMSLKEPVKRGTTLTCVHCEIAYVKWWIKNEKHLELVYVYVRPCAVGRGLGDKIIWIFIQELMRNDALESFRICDCDYYIGQYIQSVNAGFEKHALYVKLIDRRSADNEDVCVEYQLWKERVDGDAVQYFEQRARKRPLPSRRELQSPEEEHIISLSDSIIDYKNMMRLVYNVEYIQYIIPFYKGFLAKNTLSKEQDPFGVYANLRKQYTKKLNEAETELKNNTRKITDYQQREDKIMNTSELHEKVQELQNLIKKTGSVSGSCVDLMDYGLLHF